jgi:hypothetical protein
MIIYFFLELVQNKYKTDRNLNHSKGSIILIFIKGCIQSSIIILYFIEKCLSKKKKGSSKADSRIIFEYNMKKIISFFFISFLLNAIIYIPNYLIYKDYEIISPSFEIIFQNYFFIIFSGSLDLILFKNEIYCHKLFGFCFVVFSFIFIIGIFNSLFLNFYLITDLPRIFSMVLNFLMFYYLKTYDFISVYFLCFLNGLFLIILSIIFYLLKWFTGRGGKMKFDYLFLNNIELDTFILMIFTSLTKEIINYYINGEHGPFNLGFFFLLEIIPNVFLDYNEEFDSKTKKFFPFLLTAYFVSLFGCLIFKEIIILNFLCFKKDLTKNIIKRGENETNMLIKEGDSSSETSNEIALLSDNI